MKTIQKTKKSTKVENATTVKLSEKLKGKERQTTTKEKNFLYNFQMNEKNLTDKEQKRKRNKIRRQLTNLINLVVLDNLKKKSFEKTKEFIKFYKDNYILNDFSLKSLTNVTDEDKVRDYTFVLNLCKEALSKK